MTIEQTALRNSGAHYNENAINRLEAPALACIMAVICALAISELHVNNLVTMALLYITFFLISSGMFFDLSEYESFKQFAGYCAIPAIFFSVVWVGKHIASLAWSTSAQHGFLQIIKTDDTLQKLLILMPLATIFVWLGILLSAIGMRRFRRFAVPFINSDSTSLQTISSNLAIIGAIGGTVATGLTWVIQRFL